MRNQTCAGVPGQQIGEQFQDSCSLVVTVCGAAYDFGVHPEGCVVDEGPSIDRAQIHAQLDTIPECIQRSGRIGSIESEIHREVVAGSGADHQEGQVVFGRDRRDERLGTVPAGHPQQIRPLLDSLPGQSRDIDVARAFQ